jgi:hypothetical protein
VEDWVAWAGRVTVRRLREDVEHALALAETDHVAFGRDGGLPAEARAVNRGDREIGTTSRSLSNPWRDWDDSSSSMRFGAPFGAGSSKTRDAFPRQERPSA